ncbi:tRNA lysidine(34) synthetase TilS [Kingella kingae]|uniref:tRNA lysidine(34) synthetase TilS n=1 Tax=Kingella kingae TaxID=504 RepID=UPI00040934CF|nr:tRNA lysidine(34) synthetase TilS [Kingella kingae]MDK4592142.1 tRNA lysidine(34) synthetase TilS [Kingella kingae]MDK4643751.1 tRNA lysidine(34) synthetase TilS [Kingella kingae]MDK4661431.1 tRNA lysidine(34) synthetase TilS [Kingella kingae]MDK4663403.1 tRNA lysidine(34) synthetase TilS [Kingella kingae]MDK4669552.1 tRNA lysidine(34) synthetase TilS [Kingella kingae]
MKHGLSVDLFAAQLPDLRGKHVCVALSGGVDSVVLLHLFAQAQSSLQLTSLSALHIHHGLNAQADQWQAFCADYASSLHIPFTAQSVRIQTNGLGIEAAARQARYQIFAQQNADFIALAHHQNDQIETFWLAALRGGSLRALSAMPKMRDLPRENRAGCLTLLRPLLPFTREQIVQYAQQNQLDFVYDNSNDNPNFLRNWVRLHLLPSIVQKQPAHAQHLLHSIATLQEERALLDEIIAEDWQRIQHNALFSKRLWQTLSPARQHQMLHQFAQRNKLGTPSKSSLHQFAQQLRHAQSGEWTLPRGRAVLYRDYLFAVPHDLGASWTWLHSTQTSPPNKLRWHNPPEHASSLHYRAATRDDVLHTSIGRKNVFRLLQEKHVPPFARPLWAIACNEAGQCVAVANIRSSSELGDARLQCDELHRFMA